MIARYDKGKSHLFGIHPMDVDKRYRFPRCNREDCYGAKVLVKAERVECKRCLKLIAKDNKRAVSGNA